MSVALPTPFDGILPPGRRGRYGFEREARVVTR
jgi:hypothetical protein